MSKDGFGLGLRYLIGVVCILVTFGSPSRLAAEEGVIAGVDVGAAAALGRLKDRIEPGGAASLFGGYMFTDYVGLTGQAQFIVAPTDDDLSGFPDDDVAAQFGFTVGPRIELPLRDWSRPRAPGEREVVLYLTGQPGVFTGITGHAFDGTAFGVTAGGGLNFRISDPLLFGIFTRYNWVDDRVTGENGDRDDVMYITAGVGLTYNFAPPTAAARVVAQAPPAPAPAPAVRKRIVLRGVNFDFDKATIRREARPILDEAIATLRQEGRVTVVAEGHTDAVGTDAYNQALSLRRADAVRDYLVAGGVSSGRIQVQGFGESRPVASNETEDGRAQNRRVELRVGQ